MHTFEIIFIAIGAVLALIAFVIILFTILDDNWSSQPDSTGTAIGILLSLAMVAVIAFGVTMYVNKVNYANHEDTTRQLAKSYQSTHSNEKPMTLNLDSDDPNSPLPDTPAKDDVTKVFYTSPDGTVVSGGQSDYHEALKSDGTVYVFVKR